MAILPTDVINPEDVLTGFDFVRGQVQNAFANVDLTTAAVAMLVVAMSLLLFDILLFFVLPKKIEKSIMIPPLLYTLVDKVWDMRNQLTSPDNKADARSTDNFEGVLAALTEAAEKYETEVSQESKDLKPKE
ncbi:hypothetical protein SK128_014341 [Halocaridina rubra]|uniref:Uncharacterized protein n=1 Tax=Halocaridina rubra TaxID=373956 RepID=A0AAN8XHZ4_HALRR